MSDDRKYVRVYYSVVNDERFATIYADARHFGTWLQLLLVADAMYPADAPLPAYVGRQSFRALVACGLVEERPHKHYRMHGLASEREMRSHSGRIAAEVRWQSGRTADPMPRQDEHRQDEHSPRAREAEDDAAVAYFEATCKAPTGRSLTWLNELATEHGEERLCAALRMTEADPLRTYLTRVQVALTTIVIGERTAPGPRTEEEFIAAQTEKRAAPGVLDEIVSAIDAHAGPVS